MSDPSGHSNTVVVTGMGSVTPFGWGVEVFEKGLEAGVTAIRPLTVLPRAAQRTSQAGEVPAGGDQWLAALPPRRRRRLTRTERFGLCAAREAVAMSGLDIEGMDAGVFLGTNSGGMKEGEIAYLALRSGQTRLWPGPFASVQTNALSDTLARAFDLEGPVVTMTSACSAGSMAIESALQSIRSGEVEVALAGGADGLCQLTYSGFNSLRVVDAEPCLPFRVGRNGLSLGEGSGVLVLESRDHALARGASILAELAGAGSSSDAHHMTAPDPTGAGLQRAIRKALADARIEPEDVSLINAHGTGTPHNDAAEWQGLRSVFGERAASLPVMATKGAIGHPLGACGAIEVVATLIALRRGELPPTPGDRKIDPECPVSLHFAGSRPLDRDGVALSINLAFGGANAALVLRGAVHNASAGGSQ